MSEFVKFPILADWVNTDVTSTNDTISADYTVQDPSTLGTWCYGITSSRAYCWSYGGFGVWYC